MPFVLLAVQVDEDLCKKFFIDTYCNKDVEFDDWWPRIWKFETGYNITTADVDLRFEELDPLRHGPVCYKIVTKETKLPIGQPVKIRFKSLLDSAYSFLQLYCVVFYLLIALY